jgi:transposase InsO family protein
MIDEQMMEYPDTPHIREIMAMTQEWREEVGVITRSEREMMQREDEQAQLEEAIYLSTKPVDIIENAIAEKPAVMMGNERDKTPPDIKRHITIQATTDIEGMMSDGDSSNEDKDQMKSHTDETTSGKSREEKETTSVQDQLAPGAVNNSQTPEEASTTSVPDHLAPSEWISGDDNTAPVEDEEMKGMSKHCSTRQQAHIVTKERQMRPINPVTKAKRDRIEKEVLEDSIEQRLMDVVIDGIDLVQIAQEQRNCQFCNDLIQYINDDILPPTSRRQRVCILRETEYAVSDNVLVHIWQPVPSARSEVYFRIVIPVSMQAGIIKLVHDGNIGLHAGIKKTISILRRNYSWMGMYHDVESYIGQCVRCQAAKCANVSQCPPRTIYELAEVPWARVHVDFAGPFQMSSQRNLYICVVVDAFSGFVVAWPSRNIVTKNFVEKFYTNVCSIFGTPGKVVSDRGSQFESDLWTEMGELLNMKIAKTSGYKPSTNGEAERFVKSIVQLLRCMTHDHPDKWDKYLPMVCFCLNNSVHSAHGMTPYNMIFGRDGQSAMDNNTLGDPLVTVHETLEEMWHRQRYAQQIALKAHEERDHKLKELYDSSMKITHVNVGSVVWWKRPTIKPGENKKLQLPYSGPYLVVESFPEGTVTLKHLETAKYVPHRVTISQLKVANYMRQPVPEVDHEVDEERTLDI